MAQPKRKSASDVAHVLAFWVKATRKVQEYGAVTGVSGSEQAQMLDLMFVCRQRNVYVVGRHNAIILWPLCAAAQIEKREIKET